jgi:hypothetical protein
MLFMDVDADVNVPVNAMPLIDDTDFKTRKTGILAADLVSLNADIVWNFATTSGIITQTQMTAASFSSEYSWLEVNGGNDAMYVVSMPSSGGSTISNDREGVGYFSGVMNGVLPFRGPDVVFRSGGLNDLLIDDPYKQSTVIGGGSGGGSVTYTQLRREVGRFLAIGESPVDWSAEDSVRVDDILRRGLNRFYFPEPSVLGESALVAHNWSFLITDLSVSLSSSQPYYNLPSDFIRIVGKPSISGGDYPLEIVSEKDFRDLTNIGDGEGDPQYYTIKRTLSSANLAYKIGLYPTPVEGQVLQGQYLFDPPNISSSQDPIVTRPHNETIIAAILATADEMMNYETQSEGIHQERFKTLLTSSIITDRTMGGQ